MRKNPQKKEVKKESTKSKYCSFSGSIIDQISGFNKGGSTTPNKVKCPECGRKLIPNISTCTGGREDIGEPWACCNYATIKKHRRKK
jgi:hypothetical protein